MLDNKNNMVKESAVLPFDFHQNDRVYSNDDPRIIKVIGVGGGGGNAVAQMYEEGSLGVRFEVCNTDKQALDVNPVSVHRLLGDGLGAGSNPQRGLEKAESGIDEIRKMFADGTKMVFITAGMGGGTGTGASPVIAREAKKAGVLTVGLVTIPFAFELEKRIDQALDGVYELSKYVDSLLVINNERLREVCAYDTVPEAFAFSDNTLLGAVKGIADIIKTKMKINLDFEDVKTVLENGGISLISTGEAEGENRVNNAIRNAVESPLLNDNDIYNARWVMVFVRAPENPEETLKISELNDLTEFMNKFKRADIGTKYGLVYIPDMGKRVKITVLASGYGLDSKDYIADNTPQEDSGEKPVVSDRLNEDERERRRRRFYPQIDTPKRPLVYKFKDEDLDNDDLIDKVSDTDTRNRSREVLKIIAGMSAYTAASAGREQKTIEPAVQDNKIYFGTANS